ncbi:MAG TPA: hypothetical protein VGI78_06720, partial [Acetobacteraceae bacterium]
MTERHRFCVMLELDTSDPRLTEEAIVTAMASNTARDVARLRRAVTQHLARDVSRVIAIYPVEHAKMLMQLHDAVGEEIQATLKRAGLVPEDQEPAFQ